MSLSQLFQKPVDRTIEGVIKADDRRDLETEVNEFVITREISRGLDTLLDRYLKDSSSNGVWISGFFGSGKSHLLKILSLLLDQTPMESGQRPVEIITRNHDDDLLNGELLRACAIPGRSILFNIDQKADHIGGSEDSSAIILEVFVKVFNELRGYHGKQGYIAKFEFDLDQSGQWDSFRETYLAVNGREWEKDRDAVVTVRKKAFGQAYARHFDVSEEEGFKAISEIKDSYKLSIETFAEQVKSYIDEQEPGFRLNFFVDEVGQFIGENTKLMLNLQTIAETLSTVCNGRSWVFVTSQGDLDTILGDLGGHTSQDFTKIQGRFKSRLNLTSSDVKEVIQKRLLAKTEAEPEALTSIYDEHKANLVTLYRFGDDSQNFKSWRGSDEFCGFYPFHPYHFDLFQSAIEQLSKHDMFTGKHTSVGERSMLEVFQSVVKKLKDQKIGTFATFDLMFDGIENTLRGDVQSSIKRAMDHFDDPLATRILKALFLLKWVTPFKATPRNVAILLIDNPAEVDIAAHEKAVKENLDYLELQTLLQKNGDLYEFLTDTEKDIEKEIKATDYDESEVTKIIANTLFTDVLTKPKIRYEANGQDYAYTYKLDDFTIGKEEAIAINIITANHANSDDEKTLAAQCTGKPELLVILPQDQRIDADVIAWVKTNKYHRINSGQTLEPSHRSILDQKLAQNKVRRDSLKQRYAKLLSESTIYLNGGKVEGIHASDPQIRFHKVGQDLISFSFPNLKMLRGSYDESVLTKTLQDDSDLFSGTQLGGAEDEIITYLTRNAQGERIVVSDLVTHFSRRPFGWYPMATLTLIARLFRMGKVELRAGELLNATSALETLKNTRQLPNVRIKIQQQFDPQAISNLKRFYQDFFGKKNPGGDALTVGQATRTALQEEVRDLETLLREKGRYPFLAQLESPLEQLRKHSGKDHNDLLSKLSEFEDDLLTAKEDLIDPIKSFINGSQRAHYDEALIFLREQQANLADLPTTDVEILRTLATHSSPFRGNAIPQAKTAVSRLKTSLAELLTTEREKALSFLEEAQQKISSSPDFAKLTPDQQSQVLAANTRTREQVQAAGFMSAVRDLARRYQTQDYPQQLTLAAQLATPKDPEKEGTTEPTPTYLPFSGLSPKTTLSGITTEEELDQYLAALRSSALEKLKEGNRISL
jgi:hypothetical protein